MSKELEVKKQAELQAFADQADQLFEDLAIDSSDIVIPKILLMQPSSGFVNEGKATLGDFRHSLSAEKVGSILEPVAIIPFHYTKCIDVVDAGDGNKLIRKDPFNAQTSQLPREDVEDGRKVKRFTRLDFFCLVPSLMAGGSTLPCVVSFKSTGYKAGSLILTQWAEIQAANIKAKQEGRLKDIRLPFSKMFALAGTKHTNEKKQTYCVPSIQVAGDVPMDLQATALQWLQTVKTSKNIKVDASDDQEVEHVHVADGTGAF